MLYEWYMFISYYKYDLVKKLQFSQIIHQRCVNLLALKGTLLVNLIYDMPRESDPDNDV